MQIYMLDEEKDKIMNRKVEKEKSLSRFMVDAALEKAKAKSPRRVYRWGKKLSTDSSDKA